MSLCHHYSFQYSPALFSYLPPVHTHPPTHTDTLSLSLILKHTHTHTEILLHTHTQVLLHTHVSAYMTNRHIHTHTHTDTCIHTHTHSHIHPTPRDYHTLHDVLTIWTETIWQRQLLITRVGHHKTISLPFCGIHSIQISKPYAYFVT